MSMPLPVHFLMVIFAGWVNRQQQAVIEYLQAENEVLKSQLKGRRLRLTDDDRRKLAVKGKALGRKLLSEVACIVTPDTIPAWHRRACANTRRGLSALSPRGCHGTQFGGDGRMEGWRKSGRDMPSVQFAQARPSGREIQQQLHDGLFPAAIQPHEIPREVHLGAIPEIGENFLGGRFAR